MGEVTTEEDRRERENQEEGLQAIAEVVLTDRRRYWLSEGQNGPCFCQYHPCGRKYENSMLEGKS